MINPYAIEGNETLLTHGTHKHTRALDGEDNVCIILTRDDDGWERNSKSSTPPMLRNCW